MARLRSRRARWLTAGIGAALVASVGLGVAWWAGVLHLNNPSVQQYPVRGVDVSRYQGDIDWPRLAGQGIDFAFIKATEGSSYVDPRFAENLDAAGAAGLRVGAYHFFSFESPGASQADHVIATVPARSGMLPIAIDVEFYGDFWTTPAPVADVRRELDDLVQRLTANYGTRPLIYTTGEAYDRYLSGAFDGEQVWIRDVWREPALADGRAWTFWQYSDRHRLPGYHGQEPFIDLNVYAGSRADWDSYHP